MSIGQKNYWKNYESKWRERWESTQYKANVSPNQSRGVFYCLSMFPYPSGNLHMGHVRVYTISDCIARLKRMQGYEVLHPMGWDAFGLPAENAAIQRNIDPAQWTESNIKSAKEQLKALGIHFDWNRELATCHKEYYKWTQWLFLELFDRGLAYRKEALVNWDPVDQTVLANEQVDAEGKSWRSAAQVEKRLLQQWFVKITEYADQLQDDISKLTEWPEAVKRMQKAWIGRSDGSLVNFKMDVIDASIEKVSVFTTRVDTIFGVTYIAVAPDSQLALDLIKAAPSSIQAQLKAFVDRAKCLRQEERVESISSAGICLGLHAIHPLTNETIPIYLADYVLPNYGTGSVMGVPAHDERDYRFAVEHDLSIRQVIQSTTSHGQGPVTDPGHLISSGKFTGLSTSEAAKAINEALLAQGQGQCTRTYRLRDWLVSRQRYWGAPIPIIHCQTCGPVGVPIEDLPVTLPNLEKDTLNELMGGDGISPLARMKDWKETTCPKCQGPAERDTDTLDTFVDSSWYYMRYCDPQNQHAPFTKDSVAKWSSKGVNIYIGGIEHAILHLLYSRFITKFLHHHNYIPFDEPFAKLLTQGMVLGKTYRSPRSLRYLMQSEYRIDAESGKVFECKSNKEVVTGYEKMSKSKHNGVDPKSICDIYGADVTRLTMLFKAPPSHQLEWDASDVIGQSRWLARIWNLIDIVTIKANCQSSKDDSDLIWTLHCAIKRVTESLDEQYAYNVAIAELMKLTNYLGNNQNLAASPSYCNALQCLIQMLAPLAPHVASEMFERMKTNGVLSSDCDGALDVHHCAWPEHNACIIENKAVKFVIQLKGKMRGTVMIPKFQMENEEFVLQCANSDPIIRKHLNGKEIERAIFVRPRKQGSHGILNIIPE